jgi:hypothetical protein
MWSAPTVLAHRALGQRKARAGQQQHGYCTPRKFDWLPGTQIDQFFAPVLYNLL